MNNWLIGLVIWGAMTSVAAPIILVKFLQWRSDQRSEERRRQKWMTDFAKRGDAPPDIVGGTPHERAAVRRFLDGHSPRRGGTNDSARAPKPLPPPPGRVVRDSLFPSFGYRAGLERLHEATDAPARRLRRRTP